MQTIDAMVITRGVDWRKAEGVDRRRHVRSFWWCGAHEGLPGRRVGDGGSSDLHARDDNGADRCAEIEDGAMIRSEARPYLVYVMEQQT